MKKILISLGLVLFLFITNLEASKCIVYYHPNGKVSIDHPDLRINKKPDGMTMNEWIDAQFIDSVNSKPGLHIDNDLSKAALPFDVIDTSELPNASNPKDRSDRNRWRGNKSMGIKIDKTLVLRKDLFKQLDDELAKPNPGIVILVKIRRKIEKKEHD